MRHLKTLFLALVLSLSIVSFSHAATTVIQKPVSYGYKAATSRTIDTVILHATYNPGLKTQTVDGAMKLWKQYNVAPHYAIDKAGKVYQLVAEKNVAWHAGASSLPDGSTDVNSRSIGIELVYTNKETPTAAQYASLNSLLNDIKGRYNITYVLGHDQIAPSRKVDPWNFDYTKIQAADTIADTSTPSTFKYSISTLSTEQQSQMKQYSHRSSCPVPLSSLRAVTVSYIDFDGVTQQGTLIVNKSISTKTATVFKALFDMKFPIRSIAPIDAYQGSDEKSVAADNTSAFNCRTVAGTKVFSEHSYGTAIDINPRENPSTTAKIPLDTTVRGAITADVVSMMKRNGFKWGGDWRSSKDYQHFSISGR